jgi:hypothetical protein
MEFINHRAEVKPISIIRRRGDYDLIAKMTGYTKETVKAQINGKRTMTEKVRLAAIKVIENWEQLINQI